MNLLSNALNRHRLQGELESLLHVLIYYSVRYLCSNLTNQQVASFIDEYFDCFSILDGEIKCGEKKSAIIREKGRLVFSTNLGSNRVLFGSPMDSLIATVLTWFKAHYAVIDYEAWCARFPGQLPLPSRISFGRVTRTPLLRAAGYSRAIGADSSAHDDDDNDNDNDNDAFYFDNESAQVTHIQRSTAGMYLQEKDPPTPEEVALALTITSHEAMISLLQKYCALYKHWNPLDKAPSDRVDKDYVSPHPLMPNMKPSPSAQPPVPPKQSLTQSKTGEIKRSYQDGDNDGIAKTRARKKSKLR